MLYDRRGRHQLQVFALDTSPTQVRLALAERAFEAANSEFVRFKTTRRGHYEAFAPTGPDVFDTLLWNESGEITECTRGNVALLLDDRWVTPPLHCGLLGGIGRSNCLRDGRVAEAVVHLDDLPRVRGMAFVNSLGVGSTRCPRSTLEDWSPGCAQTICLDADCWSGIGKRPFWLRDALAAGKALEDFRVLAIPRARVGKRRPSTLLYSDGVGNYWTGRGPQPRWLREALATGKTLEQLKG